jgi:hypothetical protein
MILFSCKRKGLGLIEFSLGKYLLK